MPYVMALYQVCESIVRCKEYKVKGSGISFEAEVPGVRERC